MAKKVYKMLVPKAGTANELGSEVKLYKHDEVIETDDEGFLVLKGILPDDSIIWHRSMGDKVIIMLVPNMGIDYIIDKLTSLQRTLNI